MNDASDPRASIITRLYFKKILFIFLLIICGMIFLGLIVNEITPWPLARITRRAFTGAEYALVSNFSELESKTNRLENIQYSEDYPNSRLDIFTPKEINENRPVIFWIHGGAFVGGDKNDVRDYCTMLASEGFVVVNINYALAPEAKYPTPILQLGKAYEFIKDHGSDYPVDLSSIVVGGDSAGAQIALQFVNLQVNDEYQRSINISRTVAMDTISAAVSLSGLLDMNRLDETESKVANILFSRAGWAYFGEKNWQPSEQAQQSSIVGNTNSSFPATFITDGNSGSFEDQAHDLVKELERNEVSVTSRFFSKTEAALGHEFQFDMSKAQSRQIYGLLVKFIKESVGE